MRQRILSLRQFLRKSGLSGFLIPHTDEHQCEYTPDYAKRLKWLTGFGGSAGLAVLTLSAGAIYVDGRYEQQVRQQVDTKDFEPLKLTDDKLADWFLSQLKDGDRIAYDPALHTRRWIENLQKELQAKSITLVAVKENPIDGLWTDRPLPEKKPAIPHRIEFSGEESHHKRVRIAAELKADGIFATVITALDSIAWLFNIRGGDVKNTPLVIGYVILKNTGKADFYVDPDKVTDELRDHLGSDIKIHAYDNFLPAVKKLGRGQGRGERKILVDPKCSHAVVTTALDQGGAHIVEGDDPCLLPKACKNKVELKGARAAHIRDGVAMCKFLCWFDKNAPTGELNELSAAAKLLEFRQQQDHFRGLSFDTISGAGPNGAIIHYKANEQTNRRIAPDMLYLLDSGAQYLDGTTDITRTVAVGKSTEEQRDRYTRVLKGHIAMARARFPVGRSGAHLDSLARKSLWDVGLDYAHGTGHGVGSYLGVHEGPQSISSKGLDVPLMPGMILSNEPGFYMPHGYGIRIENLMVVRQSQFDNEQNPMNIFETITFVPIDTGLVNVHMMSSMEITWLNIYHAHVREKISPYLEGDELEWLNKATQSVIVL